MVFLQLLFNFICVVGCDFFSFLLGLYKYLKLISKQPQ